MVGREIHGFLFHERLDPWTEAVVPRVCQEVAGPVLESAGEVVAKLSLYDVVKGTTAPVLADLTWHPVEFLIVDPRDNLPGHRLALQNLAHPRSVLVIGEFKAVSA